MKTVWACGIAAALVACDGEEDPQSQYWGANAGGPATPNQDLSQSPGAQPSNPQSPANPMAMGMDDPAPTAQQPASDVGSDQPPAIGPMQADAGADAPAPSAMGGDAGMQPAPSETVRPPCMQDPKQVILMGDSYMNWVSHTFPQDMARNFGNGTQGIWDIPNAQGGRLYAIGAWAMGSGGIGLIPDQLDFALADDPDIIAAIMTGGGNDVLVPGAEWPGGAECKNSDANPPLPVCQDITQKAFEASRNLMMRSADAGIRDVVYFFYPEVPAPTLIGGNSPNSILSWTYPMVEQLCADTEGMTEGRLRCHFLDTRPIFEGHPEYFAPTDIHPNAEGSNAITMAIAELMRDRCIAQPESSGCCEP